MLESIVYSRVTHVTCVAIETIMGQRTTIIAHVVN